MALEHGIYMIAHVNTFNHQTGGTAILIPRDSLERTKSESHHQAWDRVLRTVRCLPRGRGIACDTLLEGHATRLASVYAPANPDERPGFFQNLNKKGHRFINRHTILGIDANCVPDVSLDRQSNAVSPYNNTGADTLNHVIASLGLIDVAREYLGDDPFFTSFHHTVAGDTATRIDRIYAPDRDGLTWEHKPVLTEMFPRPPGARILDHEPAQISLKQTSHVRGKAIPRINETIYNDATFLDTLALEIDRQINTPAQGEWGDAWLRAKEKIKAMSIAQTRKIKRKQTKQLKELLLRAKPLKTNIDSGQASPQEHRQYIELQAETDAIRRDTFFQQMPEDFALQQGAKHDTGSAAFFRPWKPRDSYHWVDAIFNATWTDPNNPVRDGTTTTEPSEIPKAITPYYESLYSHKPSDPVAMQICLDTLRSGNRVQRPTATKCGAPISRNELEDTMNLLPTGKSPGPDCIPNKFYKVFSAKLAPILAKVFQESKSKGSLPEGVGDGIITVLYKKLERDDPRHYRSITLLNSDYKILMRVLTARMNEAVPQFVSDPQTGFVPDSFLPENTMLLNLIQAWAEDEEEELYFLFLDMEKAFDRCSWEFMFEAARVIGFDQHFIDMIKLAYSDTTRRRITANGYVGPYFSLHSGVAQGRTMKEDR